MMRECSLKRDIKEGFVLRKRRSKWNYCSWGYPHEALLWKAFRRSHFAIVESLCETVAVLFMVLPSSVCKIKMGKSRTGVIFFSLCVSSILETSFQRGGSLSLGNLPNAFRSLSGRSQLGRGQREYFKVTPKFHLKLPHRVHCYLFNNYY